MYLSTTLHLLMQYQFLCWHCFIYFLIDQHRQWNCFWPPVDFSFYNLTASIAFMEFILGMNWLSLHFLTWLEKQFFQIFEVWLISFNLSVVTTHLHIPVIFVNKNKKRITSEWNIAASWLSSFIHSFATRAFSTWWQQEHKLSNGAADI